MSDSHEPSYYEIALTNRQVLIAFVILLVCLVAAFLSGVWVGHGDTPTRPERIAEASPAADDADGEAVESLSFFGGDDGARPAPTPPSRDTTLAQDAGVEPAPARTEPQPAPARTEPAPARTEPTPAPRPTPPPSAPAGSNAAAPTPSRSATGDLIVQVFSSRDRDQALKVVNRLQGGGRDAFLSPVEVEGQPMYRVRLGPFSDRGLAEQVSRQIRSEFQLDTWITSR